MTDDFCQVKLAWVLDNKRIEYFTYGLSARGFSPSKLCSGIKHPDGISKIDQFMEASASFLPMISSLVSFLPMSEIWVISSG